MYGIVHPAEQWESGRPVRLSPVYDRERDLGAVFIETAGWERPNWYASNEALLDRYAGRLMEREAEWEARWWSPIINAEHLAMRDACGLVDLSAFAVFDVIGPGALAAVQSVAVAQLDVRVGPGRLHLAARRARRLPRRPDDHAPGAASGSAWSPAARPG